MKYLSLRISKNLFWSFWGLISISLPVNAFQLDITSVDTTLVPGTSGSANGINFDGDQLRIDSFTANGSTWETTINTTSFIRRNDRGGTVPNHNLVWQERIDSATNLRGPVPTSTEAALNSNNLFVGSDNLFVNSNESAGNESSIERVDYILDSSTTSASDTGFTVFERGSDNGHDEFNIALILGTDGTGNPDNFSDFIAIGAGTWGQTNLEDPSSLNATRSILRDDNGDMVFSETSSVVQNIGGFLITLDQFTEGGNAITAPILGYSLFGGDVDGNSSTLGDVTSSAFPNSASNSTEGGLGLDPIAANIGLVQQVPFEFSSGLGLLLSGGGLLGFNYLKKKKQSKKLVLK